ncbi:MULTISPECIES: hypothetical protein [Haloferax]|nr:hypothetical protein [Haloferax mediterranei]MDX5990141.1 hypothetical protein [Haloferax mediterranei ATCC 33500]
MADLPRRKWVLSVGSGVSVLLVGFRLFTPGRFNTGAPDGTPDEQTKADATATSDDLARDRGELSYELDADGSVEFEYRSVEFEAGPDGVEFTTVGEPNIDFEAESESIEVTVVTETDAFDFEYNGGNDIEFETPDDAADTDVEVEDAKLEYEGVSVDFEWEKDDEIEIEIDGGVRMEYSPDEFTWVGNEITFEWEKDDNEFEVSRINRPRRSTDTA